METLEAPAIRDTSVGTSSPEEPKSRSFFHCLLLMLAIPVLLYPTAFLVVSAPSYERWGTSKWGPVLDYAFSTTPKNADVLIFGDSSAFLGIDPRVVNQELGIKSIVLPATIGSLPVVGDKALQTYLAHNAKPRLLVFYFTPWNLDYQNTSKIGLFEGEEMLLRHGTWREIAAFGRHHAGELFKFPFRFYNSFTPKAIVTALRGTSRQQATANALGHVDYTEPRPPLASSCVVPEEYLKETQTGSVEELVHRYSTPQMKVMVYIAPIPHCNNVEPVLHDSFNSLNAAPPQALPPGFFSADPYYAHLRPESVPAASRMFAQVLESRMKQDQLSSGMLAARNTSAKPE